MVNASLDDKVLEEHNVAWMLFLDLLKDLWRWKEEKWEKPYLFSLLVDKQGKTWQSGFPV